MSDSMDKTSSSWAIVEKKPHRTGACVGIFFQLFDWNRRFAKKKLFSKKLLPPVRLKQASKKFGGDEKQPKLRLIADENSGGFPTTKNSRIAHNLNPEPKHEMRAPGLVARLMGLESMPASHRGKSKKVSKTEESNIDKAGIKNESRPQKLQKMSTCESQPIIKFGAEKLPFKNVLSRPQNHHSKLPSPVKSPRNLSRKTASKLIGAAAAKILEPGRSKCALTYPNSAQFVSNQSEESIPFSRIDPKSQPSCRNCGHFVDNFDSKPSEKPVIFASPFCNYVGCPCQVSETSNLVIPTCNHELEDGSQRGFRKFAKANDIIETKKFDSDYNGPSFHHGKSETGRRIGTRKNDPIPPGRKRRPSNISKQGETSAFSKQIYSFFPREIPIRETGHNIHHMTLPSSRNGSLHFQEKNAIAKKRVQNNLFRDGISHKSAFTENGLKSRFEKPVPLSGDALGALLEQKLKELTSQGEVDIIGGDEPQKTTAMILQELISALAPEMPRQQEKSTAIISRKSSSRNHSRMSDSTSSTSFQAKVSVDQPLDPEHLSPGSVLEAYSPNTSSLSSNLDDNSFGYKMLPESINHSENLATDIMNGVSHILRCINRANFGLKGSKFDYTKEVLLNAELVLENVFSIKHLILDELETLGTLLWMNFGCSIGVEECKDSNIFALDSIIEYLDSRFCQYYKTGPKLSIQFPLCMNTNKLIFEIVEEVGKWEESSKFIFDDLIEREMGFSIGEWAEFGSEKFEIGVEISRRVVQNLVEEIVTDIWD